MCGVWRVHGVYGVVCGGVLCCVCWWMYVGVIAVVCKVFSRLPTFKTLLVNRVPPLSVAQGIENQCGRLLQA